MALRLNRQSSMGTPAGGGSLSISSDGKTLTINKIMRFRHFVNRFADAVPLPGGFAENDSESQALIYDIGGVRIEYSFEFILSYDNETDFNNDYADIDKFLSTIQMMEFMTLELDENGWTVANGTARNVVLKSFDLERQGGEAYIIRGRIQLLGGKPVG